MGMRKLNRFGERCGTGRVCVSGAAAFVLAASSASAALVNFSWTTIISDIGPWKAPLPGMEKAMVGDKAFITFSINTAVPDTCQAPLAGCYSGAVSNMTYRIPRIGYVYHGNSGDLTVINRSVAGSLEEIRIEAVLPGLDANFLLWLRTYNFNALSTASIPTAIDLNAFDYTYYAGFYGTATPTSNILSGKPFNTSTCPADLNTDKQVDDADFVLFLQAYNTLDCFDAIMAFGCPADLNADGFVDDADFVVFVKAYDALVCP